MMTPGDIFNDMRLRCAEVHVFHRQPGSGDESSAAMGTLIRLENDACLAVEVGLTDDGIAHVTARAYTATGEVKPLTVLDAPDGSIYITS